jgi:hypothetical protein
MSVTLMTLLAKLGLDSGGFVDGMDAAAKVAEKGTGNITASLSKVGFDILKVGAIAGAAAVAGLAVALGSTIGPASDLAETVSKVGVVFGDSADEVLAFGKTSAKALGMSENSALAAAGTYGNLFRAMGMAEEASADMSVGLVSLAGDLASFNNMDPTEVMDALRAGLSGETEPLKRLGVNINQATIEAKAMELGLYDLNGELSVAGKAQASYALIMEQTTLAQGDFARTSKGLANQQRILKASFENVKTTIGTALLPAVNAFMNVVTGIVSTPAFQEWLAKAVEWLSAVATKVVDVIGLLVKGDISGALTSVFGSETATKIINVTSAISGFIKQVADFVSNNAEAFKGALIAIAALLGGAMIVTGITKIATAIGTLTSPVGLIIAAVGLLGAAWAGNWGGIQEKTQAVIAWLTPYVNGAITAISDWWAANGATIIATVVATWEWIKTAISDAIAYIGPIVSGAIAAISTWWTENGATIIGTITATWTWIQGIFQAAVDVIQPIVQNALASISVWWSAWGSTVMSGVQNVWNWIVGAFQTYFEVVRAVVETVWGVIQAIWEAYGNKIMAVITNVWTIIQTVFETAFTFIKTLFEGFVLLFNGDVEGFVIKVTEAFTALWDGIVKIVTLAWDNIKLVAAVAMDAIGLALTAAWEWVKGIFASAWEAIVTGVTSAWESFKTALTTLVDNVIAFFTDTNWGEVGMNIINGIVQGIRDAATWLWDTVTGLLTGLLDKIKEFFGIASPSKLMAAKIGEPLIEGIGVGMERAMKLLEGAQLPDMTARLIATPSAQVAAQPGNAQGNQGNTYIMHINTSTSSENLIGDFALMQAMAGA